MVGYWSAGLFEREVVVVRHVVLVAIVVEGDVAFAVAGVEDVQLAGEVVGSAV